MNDILSHAEIQALIIRNNAQPQLGVPEYRAWSDNKLRPRSQAELDEANRKANLGLQLTHCSWLKKLDSKRWRINQGKGTRIIMRTVRSRDSWIEVELNTKVR